jgi:hypothetical protein
LPTLEFAVGAVCGPSGRILLVGLTRRAGAGRLGYAEAVQVELPTARMGEFAGTFFERFRGGVRHDPQDVGGEYRSVLGLPGGFSSPLLAAFEAPARRAGMTLVQGKGSDTDTLGAKTVLVPPAAVGPQPIAAGLNPKARRRVSARRRARGARGLTTPARAWAGVRLGGVSVPPGGGVPPVP